MHTSLSGPCTDASRLVLCVPELAKQLPKSSRRRAHVSIQRHLEHTSFLVVHSFDGRHEAAVRHQAIRGLLVRLIMHRSIYEYGAMLMHWDGLCCNNDYHDTWGLQQSMIIVPWHLRAGTMITMTLEFQAYFPTNWSMLILILLQYKMLCLTRCCNNYYYTGRRFLLEDARSEVCKLFQVLQSWCRLEGHGIDWILYITMVSLRIMHNNSSTLNVIRVLHMNWLTATQQFINA